MVCFLIFLFVQAFICCASYRLHPIASSSLWKFHRIYASTGNVALKSSGICLPTLAHTLVKPLSELGSSMVVQRTHKCLDFGVLTENLQKECKTTLGIQLCGSSSSNVLSTVKQMYEMVAELNNFLEYIPLHSRMDIWKVISAIQNNSAEIERGELAQFSFDMEAVADMQRFLVNHANQLTLFQSHRAFTQLPAVVMDVFNGSFGTDLLLNPDKYPVLRQLQIKIDKHKASIAKTLESLLKSEDMRDKIAERYVGYTRYCAVPYNRTNLI